MCGKMGCSCEGVGPYRKRASYEGEAKKAMLREVWRFIAFALLFVIASGVFFGDEGSIQRIKLVLYVVGVEAMVVYAAHLLRRLMFPSFNFGEALHEACEIPLGAAITISAITALTIALIVVPFWFLIAAASA